MSGLRFYAWGACLLAISLYVGATGAQETAPGAASPPNNAAPAASAPAAPDAGGGLTPATSEEPAEVGRGKMPTFYDLFMTNVPINTAILVLSVIALVMFLFLLLSLTVGGFAPHRFVENLNKLILSRQFDQAIHLCQTNSGLFISSIIQRVLENRDKEHAALIEIVSAEGRRRAEPIWNRVNLLSEIANIAPLLGLLGTVIGMIHVFFTLTTRTAGEKATELAGGIATAMGATMNGLFVAIGAGVFYTLLRSRATTVLAEAERACHALADETARAAVDPRLRKIDALAEAARAKIAQATSARSAPPPPGAPTPIPQPSATPGFSRPPQP